MSTLAGCSSKQKDKEITGTDVVTEAPTQEPTQAPTEEPTLEPTTEAVAQPTEEVAEPITHLASEIEAAGTIDGVTYTNSLIGFSVNVPESWLVYNADETYSYLVSAAGGTEENVEALRTQLNDQGVTYVLYGVDTQFSTNGGTDNLLVQVMNASLFGGLGVDIIISSLSQMIEQQYISMGATCTIGDAVKSTIDDQDVYQVSAVANMDVTVGETTTTQTVRQEYIIFMKNDVLVYMALSTALEDSASLAKTIIDTLSFQ